MDKVLGPPVELATKRLRLRPMTVDDAEDMFAIKGDPEVTGCYGQEPHRSVEETLLWIEKRVGREERDSLFWTLTPKGGVDVIGACCLWNFDLSRRCAEIGYELHPAHWRKGIMTEAVAAIVSYGFTDLGLDRIEATPLARNIASKGVLLKLGFREEGIGPQVFFQGRFEDQTTYGLLREEWSRQKR